ncbi:hypothetical protein [Nonomuraea ceibae]|nr:hypothetical protein [Nonomuraea ceibae]
MKDLIPALVPLAVAALNLTTAIISRRTAPSDRPTNNHPDKTNPDNS